MHDKCSVPFLNFVFDLKTNLTSFYKLLGRKSVL